MPNSLLDAIRLSAQAKQEELANERILQFMLALAPITMSPALSGARSMEEMAEWTVCAAAELNKAYCNCCEIETYEDDTQGE